MLGTLSLVSSLTGSLMVHMERMHAASSLYMLVVIAVWSQNLVEDMLQGELTLLVITQIIQIFF